MSRTEFLAVCVLLGAFTGCGSDQPGNKSQTVRVEPENPGNSQAGKPQTSNNQQPGQTETNSPVPAKPNPKSSLPARPEPISPKTEVASVDRPAEELELLHKIAMEPAAKEPRLAYAEWLDTRDAPRAEVIRLRVKFEGLERDDPQRKELQTRINELVEQHREAWTKLVAALLGEKGWADVDAGYVTGLECADVTDAKLACLTAVPTLQHLTLNSGRITKEGAAKIAALPNPRVISLYDNVQLSEDALDAFHDLAPWAQFECYCEGVDRKALNAVDERRMERFDGLPGPKQRQAACRFLQAVSYRPIPDGPIKIAELSQVGINDAQMRFFRALPEVEEIYISEAYDLTSKGLESLKHLKNLKRLELWDTQVESLVPIMHHTSLQILNAYPEFDTTMGDAGLGSLENLVNLEEMYLSDEGISDETLKRITSLKKLRKLDLTLGGGIRNESNLSALSGLVELEQLSLHGGKYGDAGLAHFANLKNLVMLNTRVDRGKGEGLKHLAGLPELRYLYLSGDAITDAGIRHLAPLTGLRTFMAQGSTITPAGATWLAEKLPRVTIILDEAVVKSPRETFKMKRRGLQDVASVLLPEDWMDDSRSYGDSLWVGEDGWEKIGGWSGGKVGPASIHLYVEDAKANETPEEAVMAIVKNNNHLNPVIIERNVVSFGGQKGAATCIYRNDHGQSLVCAGQVGDKMVSFWCEAPPARFEEFRPLFFYVARSARLSTDVKQHESEDVEVATKELARQAKSQDSPGDE